MASVNKVIIDDEILRMLYLEQGMSVPQISEKIVVSRSTVRVRLKELCVLRSRSDAIRLASTQGRIGAHLRGKKRQFTSDWCAKISAGKLKHADANAKGVSLKPNGYIEHTRGENKGRSVHVTLIEAAIGRRLAPHEIVHHKDHNRSNNAEITGLSG